MAERGAMLHEAHFESLERQAQAARLGMWVFLSSEVLLFGGLFGLYGAYRAMYPAAFEAGIAGNDVVLGTINTVVLITSSWLVALGVHALRVGKAPLARLLLLGTLFLGLVFLVFKGVEYGHHIGHGELPGALGRPDLTPDQSIFFTLYFATTGLHAIHVIVGMGLLAFFAWDTRYGRTDTAHAYRLELGAMYWHLVDVIWIFVWPLYYLLR